MTCVCRVCTVCVCRVCVCAVCVSCVCVCVCAHLHVQFIVHREGCRERQRTEGARERNAVNARRAVPWCRASRDEQPKALRLVQLVLRRRHVKQVLSKQITLRTRVPVVSARVSERAGAHTTSVIIHENEMP
jgi:hypothetical protein